MSRISGIELNDRWKVDYALTKIKGVGWAISKKLLSSAGVKTTKRVVDLTSDEVAKITTKLEEFATEGDLIRVVRSNVARLQTIGSYRGRRHSQGLPAHGQRTRSNARTKRGKRKTVGAFRKEALAKMASAKDVK